MEIIKGKFTEAKVFTGSNASNLEEYARAQIKMICDNETSDKSCIRVMPDVHPGKVGPIGLTMTIGNKIMPSLVGIDMGCGMSSIKIKSSPIENQKLDRIIREHIPSGFGIRKEPHSMAESFDFSQLHCINHIRIDKSILSLGTLGGGNHFIEIGRGNNNLYLTIHSGSRSLGKEIYEYYMREGQKSLKAKGIKTPYELTYLEGSLMEEYLHDLAIATEFASLNRQIMIKEISKGMKWKSLESIECIHNYVDNSDEIINILGLPILRKGAVSAVKGADVIIPINMKDGIIIGKGLGNDEWNLSAPHGAGRIFKREDVKKNFTLSQYKKEMKGIYSSCINQVTLDEAPFAYRRLNDIKEIISETITIKEIIEPIYNFKAGNN